MILLDLPSATRERAMIRLQAAEATHGSRPIRAAVGPIDYKRLTLDFRRYGKAKPPYDILRVPIVEDTTVPDKHIKFTWEPTDVQAQDDV